MFLRKSNKLSGLRLAHNTCSGFTLIEIIIAVAILGMLSVFLYDFLNQSFQIQNFVFEQSEAIAQARNGMESFTKELREATNGDNGIYALESANEQEVIFYSDIDADAHVERVRYFIEDNSLKKGVIDPTGSPLEYTGDESVSIISLYIINEENSIFTYYDDTYPVQTTPLAYPADVTQVSLIKIHLEINVNPEKIPDTYTLDTVIQIRNLKDNL